MCVSKDCSVKMEIEARRRRRNDDNVSLLSSLSHNEEEEEVQDIMQIACSDADRALFDELHDLYQSGEREKISVLFLDKTSRAFEINSGNYTAWMIRRRCLLANPLYLDTAELEFVRVWVYSSLKNYQVWCHRRWVFSHLLKKREGQLRQKDKRDRDGKDVEEKEEEDTRRGQEKNGRPSSLSSSSSSSSPSIRKCRDELLRLFDDERDDLTQVLWKDSKNMAAWAYRAWLSRTRREKMSVLYDIESSSFYDYDIEEDLESIGRLIEDDPYNNSAWTSRMTTVKEYVTHHEEEISKKKKKKALSSLLDSSSSPFATASLHPGKDAKKRGEEEEERNGGCDWSCRDDSKEKEEEEEEEEEEKRRLRIRTESWRRELEYALESWEKLPDNEAALQHALGCIRCFIKSLLLLPSPSSSSSLSSSSSPGASSSSSQLLPVEKEGEEGERERPAAEMKRLHEEEEEKEEEKKKKKEQEIDLKNEKIRATFMLLRDSVETAKRKLERKTRKRKEEEEKDGEEERRGGEGEEVGEREEEIEMLSIQGAEKCILEVQLYLDLHFYQNTQSAIKRCHLLEKLVDPLRSSYWVWRREEIRRLDPAHDYNTRHFLL